MRLQRVFFGILLLVLSLSVIILLTKYNNNDKGHLKSHVALRIHQNLNGSSHEGCPSLYGKVFVFSVYKGDIINHQYRVAQESLQCYLRGKNYPFVFIDVDKDERTLKACSHHKDVFFKKHCAAAEYLKDGDWMLVLDADTGVVNPHHCVEEWIDPRVHLVFYERFFNWEIASGNYIARNTQFSYDFLKNLADWEFKQPANWSGLDNGVLQMHILQTVLPDAQQEIRNCDSLWQKATKYENYMAYVNCVKLTLGATKIWPDQLRIYRRGHGWVRDGFFTSDRWGPSDFMLHGWKHQNIGDDGWNSPFERRLNASECGKGDEGWHWRNDSFVKDEDIRKGMNGYEKTVAKEFPKEARVIPHLQAPDVGECYPHCDEATDRRQ